MLTQAQVKELFEYKDGDLIWKVPVFGRGGSRLGKVAGTINQTGKRKPYFRWKICINQQLYSAHQIVWLYHHGYFPTQLDHIDRNALNNRIENLRLATYSQNHANKDIYANNTSGYKGVTWHPQACKWTARIGCKKKYYYLGIFESKHDAARAYNKKAFELFGEFAFLNEIKEELNGDLHAAEPSS